MVKDGAAVQDLHFGAEMAAAGGGVKVGGGFDAMEEGSQVVVIEEKDMWLDRDEDGFLDVNEASIFYGDFPPLPDFPCMSSSSSSSSTQPQSKPIGGASTSSSATSSSPATSWALMRSDAEEEAARVGFQQLQSQQEVKMEGTAALSSTASMEIQAPSEHDGGALGCDVDCIDVMENFGYMDLIDCNELWDPSSVFQSENPQDFLDEQAAAVAPPLVEGSQQGNDMICEDDNDGFSFLQGNSELAMIFFEWLKQNKDYISAEDMRSIKLKRSTIESASKRLGSSKEGKKQLLKLILEWVEQYQLQKKLPPREGSGAAAAQPSFSFEETVQIPDPNQNPNFMYNPDPNATFPTTQWMQPPPPEVTPMVAAPPPQPFAPAMPGYNNDPYIPMNHGVVNGIPYQHSGEYPVMEHAPSWALSPFPVPPSQFSPFPDNGGNIINRQQNVYGNPYQMYDPNGERMMRLGSSATKEARKKRMARQRRLYSHHHRHCSNSNQSQNQPSDPHLVGDGADDGDQGGDWMFWSNGGDGSSPTAAVPAADASQQNSGDRASMQPQNSQRQASTDRRPQQVDIVYIGILVYYLGIIFVEFWFLCI